MSLTLLFPNGGSPVAAPAGSPTYPNLIIMLSGRIALHVGNNIYMEL